MSFYIGFHTPHKSKNILNASSLSYQKERDAVPILIVLEYVGHQVQWVVNLSIKPLELVPKE